MKLSEIQDSIFDLLEFLYKAENNRNKNSYKLALASIDLLNKDHKDITGHYFVDEKRIMEYHEKQWSVEWKKF
jgi:hypothetical protein